MMTFTDEFLCYCAVPMLMLGGFFFTVLGLCEIGGRIRAKIKGEKWESPIVW